jgi:uncharacterized protein (DUF58 family)
MIVPRNRLLIWFGAIAPPLALLAAAVPRLAPECLVGIAGLLFVSVADALRASRAVAGIGVQFPPIVRMSKDREGPLDLRIQNASQKRRGLRIGLALPQEILAETPEQDVTLPPKSEWSRLSWNCLPRMRGRFHAGPVYVEGVSPLGMWSIRRPISAETEIRVYPDLMTERKSLASLFLRRGIHGFHLLRQVGKGRDFEKLREYVPGDSFDDIHWKATARRARPITKVFQIERTQEIYVVVDASRLSARRLPAANVQADGPPILERMVTAALVLGLAAQQQGDLFGLITFTDKVETFVRAKNGKAHYNTCRDALYTLQPQIVTPDFGELYTFIRLRLRRRALIIFLTSLDDPALAENFVRSVELIRRQHLLLVNMIRQPGIEPLFTNPKIESIDDIYGGLGGHLRWHKLRQLEKTLQRRGVKFSLIDNERLSADLVSQYLNVKQKQLL